MRERLMKFLYSAYRQGALSNEEYSVLIGNVQGGWKETLKYKNKDGNWVTRTAWGSGKAGW